jgi:FkbM family methyltransferase
MGKKIFDGGIYEPAIIATIQTFVKNGYSFVDIGANIGLHTLAAAFARVDSDQIFISFEPDADIYSILVQNCSINYLGFVKCFQQGVGDQDTHLRLNVSATNNKGRSSFLYRENTYLSSFIRVSTLDTLFLKDDRLTLSNLLIKIDTEGYELPILRGGVQWLSKVKNAAIIYEVSPSIMQQNNMLVEDLFKLLMDCGFSKRMICKDVETVFDLGSRGDQYNVISCKGPLSEQVFSVMAPELKWAE